MKKLALSAILGASLMITSSAFALTSMSSDSMKAATGQAGVSIAIDNVVIESYTGETVYTDDDGVSTGSELQGNYVAGQSASVVISGKHTLKEYYAMTDATDYRTTFATATGLAPIVTAAVLGDDPTTTGVVETDFVITPAVTTYQNKGTWTEAAALSIDVGRCAVLSAGKSQNVFHNNTALNVGGVVIGLPTLLIKTSGDKYSVGIRLATAAAGAGINANQNKNFITITKSNSVMAILGGTLEIAPH